MGIQLSKILRDKTVIAKAPTRVDLGGGIDHRVISLLCQKKDLITFNIAIKLFTYVTLEPYRDGYVFVESENIGEKEMDVNNFCFNDKFGLVAAIVSFFGVSGVKIKIKTDFPSMSGLGGSGSLSIALISAFVKVLNLNKTYNQKDIVWLAHSIEDSLFKNTGLQDQAAAFYGGINVWEWNYGHHKDVYKQLPIKQLNIKFEENSLLIYSGCPHYLTRKGSKIIYSFFNKKNSIDFVENVNENTKNFLYSLSVGNLDKVAKYLDKEEILRHDFLNYKIPSSSAKIIDIARKNGCGIKFVGGGGGGCLWILGEQKNLKTIKDEISKVKNIKILPFLIDYQGVSVKISNK
jgi:galactokinase/mevalonate kinase-like predicted kinase